MYRIETHTGPRGVRLVLDSREIDAEDPGNGTPAMLTFLGETSTYWCALETGYCGEAELPDMVFSWVEKQIGLVDDFHCQFMGE